MVSSSAVGLKIIPYRLLSMSAVGQRLQTFAWAAIRSKHNDRLSSTHSCHSIRLRTNQLDRYTYLPGCHMASASALATKCTWARFNATSIVFGFQFRLKTCHFFCKLSRPVPHGEELRLSVLDAVRRSSQQLPRTGNQHLHIWQLLRLNNAVFAPAQMTFNLCMICLG